jgi:hypothetical protein
MVLPFLAGIFGGGAAASTVGAAVAGSLVNGAINRHQQKKANKYNDPAAIAARYYAAGINPRLAFANGNPYQMQPFQSNFSQNLLQAQSTAMQDDREGQALELEKQKLQQQQKLLQKERERSRLASQRPSVFESQTNDYSINQSLSSNAPRLRHFVGDNVEIKQEEASIGTGLISIDNKLTGGEIILPGADGEPWGVDELATAVVVGAPQVFANQLSKHGVKGVVKSGYENLPPIKMMGLATDFYRDYKKTVKRKNFPTPRSSHPWSMRQ